MDGFGRWVGGEGTRHSDVTAAELGWYSIARSSNSPTLLPALPETDVGDGRSTYQFSRCFFTE